MEVLSLVRQQQIAALESVSDDALRGHYGPGRITPLMIAAETGSFSVVTYLLRRRGVPVDSRSTDGKTALVIAGLNGRVEAVRLLLDLGADPNVTDTLGMTALMHVVWTRPPEASSIATLLLDRGADVAMRDNTGKTAEDWIGPKRKTSKLPFLGDFTLYRSANQIDPLRHLIRNHQAAAVRHRPER